MRILVDTDSTDGSLVFGDVNTGDNYNNISFIPMSGDEKRKLSGILTLLMGSSNIEGETVRLRVVDNETNEVIGEESQFLIPNSNNWGLLAVRLQFNAKQLNPNSPYSIEHHQIVIEGRSSSGTVSNLLLNSAYISYY
jgi:hypothetical protein